MISQLLNYFQVEQLLWARPISTGAMLAAFAAVIALTAYLYLRPRGLPTWVRISLAVGRLIVLCLIVAAMFEPTAAVRQTLTHKRRLPVLIDVSQSMSVKDQRKRPEDIVEAAAALGILPLSEIADANGASMSLNTKQHQTIAASSRLDLARSLLTQPTREMLESLGDDLEVSYYAFGKTLRRLGDGQIGAADSLAALKAVEPGTSIAESLDAVAKSDRGAPLAGIVLLTDGLDTSSRRADDAIHDLGTHGIPVYPVAMGIADPDDISIRNIIMQEVAFSGDKVPVRVQIRSKGYERRTADLTVLLNGRSVAQRSISFDGGLQFEDI
ncbi:MAG: VWA domain-containing protein, partial [Candidatus Nealsonbacteria bacterium]|nr:VWA domain-containing protein [Candidatus Nealsonbacteria bacterium]